MSPIFLDASDEARETVRGRAHQRTLVRTKGFIFPMSALDKR